MTNFLYKLNFISLGKTKTLGSAQNSQHTEKSLYDGKRVTFVCRGRLIFSQRMMFHLQWQQAPMTGFYYPNSSETFEAMWNDHCLSIISRLLICVQDVALHINYYSLMSNSYVNCPDWIFQSKCNKTGTVVICALRRRCLSVFWTALCQQHLLSCCGQYWSSLSMG